MNTTYDQNRTLHKFVLYLILLNFLLIGLYAFGSGTLSLQGQSAVSLLLVTYNVLLMRLIKRKAINRHDSYLIYPVISGAMMLSISLFYVYFIQ